LKARSLRVAIAQIDTTVGDFPGNSTKIVAHGRRAEESGADLVLFPELAVSGYPPRDLLERQSFLRESERTVERIARESGSAIWLYGAPIRNRARTGRAVFNAAIAARNGRRIAVYHKRLLPTYDVFDEGHSKADSSGQHTVTLPPYGHKWFRVGAPDTTPRRSTMS